MDELRISTVLDTKGFEAGSKRLGDAIKSFGAGVDKTMKTVKGAGTSILRTIMKWGPALLGVRGVYQTISKATQAFMSENQQLSANLSSAWTALGNVLGPIITTIVNLITTAMSYFINFLKLLGLTSKSASEASKSAKGAGSELKKQLMGFDELNVLNDSGGGGGASGQLTDKELPEWLQEMGDLLKKGMFEQAGRRLAQQLNDMVNSVDWEGLGTKVGKAFDACLKFLYGVIDEFDWRNLGARLATGFSFAISTVDWDYLGKVIVGFFTGLVDTVVAFFDPQNMNYTELGNAMYEFVKGALDELIAWLSPDSEDGKDIGERLGGNIVTAISNFFDGLTGDGKGAELAQKFSIAIASVLKVGYHFLQQIVMGIWNGIEEWWKIYKPPDGKFTLSALITALGNWIGTIGQDLMDNVVTPFFTTLGLKLDEGVEEPTLYDWINVLRKKVLEKIEEVFGTETAQRFERFFNDLEKLFNTVGRTVSKIWALLSPFIDWVVNEGIPLALEKLEELIDLVGDVIALLSGEISFSEFCNQLSDFQSKVLLAVAALLLIKGALKVFDTLSSIGKKIEGFTTTLGTLKEKFGLVKTAISGLSSPMLLVIAVAALLVGAFVTLWNTNEEFREKITKIWEQLKTDLNTLVDGLKERFEKIAPYLSELWEDIKTDWTNFCNILAPIFEEAFALLEATFEVCIGLLLGIIDIFIGLFTGDWDTMWQGVKEVASSAWKFIKDLFINTIGIIKGIVNGFLAFFGTDWDSVFDGIKADVELFWSDIKAFFQSGVDAIIGIWDRVKNFFGIHTVNSVPAPDTQEYRDAYAEMIAAQNAYDQACADAAGTFSEVDSKYLEALNAATDKVNQIKINAQSGMSDLEDIVVTGNEKIAGELAEGEVNAAEVAREAIQSAQENMENMITNYNVGATSLEILQSNLSSYADTLRSTNLTSEEAVSAFNTVTSVMDGLKQKLGEGAENTEIYAQAQLLLAELTGQYSDILAQQGIILDENGTVVQNTASAVTEMADASKEAAQSQQETVDALSGVNTQLNEVPSSSESASAGIGSTTEEFDKLVEAAKADAEATVAQFKQMTTDIETEGASFQEGSNTYIISAEDLGTAITEATTQAIEDFNTMNSSMAEVLDSISIDATDFGELLKTTIESATSSAKTAIQGFCSDMKIMFRDSLTQTSVLVNAGWQGVINVTSSGVNAITNLVNQATVVIATAAWYWGADLMINMTNGIIAGWNAFEGTIASVAAMIRMYLGFSEPEKGPLSNFHTFMPDMMQLMADGIKDNMDLPMNAVEDLADGISDEIQSGDYALGDVASGEIDIAMDHFADRIVDGFTNLIARLEDIAANVTFGMPAVAMGGVVPYSIGAGIAQNGSERQATADDIVQAIYGLQALLSNSNGNEAALNVNVYLDGQQITDVVTKRQRQTGRSWGTL